MKADGIMGLSPTSQGTQADLIYNTFTASKTFSIAIVEATGVSKMTFGGLNLAKY
jgi:hypothetical protein